MHCRTSDEMTLNATAACATSQDNSIIFSAISIDVTAADQAYQRYVSPFLNFPYNCFKMLN